MIADAAAASEVDSFGHRLRELRHRRGLSQLDLAALTGLTDAAIRMWENGQRPGLTADSLERLARAFGTTMDALWRGPEAEPWPAILAELDGTLAALHEISETASVWLSAARECVSTDEIGEEDDADLWLEIFGLAGQQYDALSSARSALARLVQP